MGIAPRSTKYAYFTFTMYICSTMLFFGSRFENSIVLYHPLVSTYFSFGLLVHNEQNIFKRQTQLIF